jgi:hypothetical protein
MYVGKEPSQKMDGKQSFEPRMVALIIFFFMLLLDGKN